MTHEYSVAANNPSATLPYRVSHDPTTERLSTAIVDAVCDVADVTVTEMDSLLYDSIDPDALNALFRDRYDGTPREGGIVELFLLGYRVVVHSDACIVVEAVDDENSDAASE